jgi:hypothetical protein
MKFSILSWGAWSPHYQHNAEWQAWPKTVLDVSTAKTAVPKLPQVPAMQRRRLSKLTKIILDAIFQCEPPPQCRSIFASQHGEINRTISLLNDIVDKSALSPTAFSQSVHNTASGIFSIISQNRAASTSIAAGSETLSQAFIEAYALLVDDPAPVLLSYADDTVPNIYKPFTSEPEWPIAMAFLVAPITSPQAALATINLSELCPKAATLSFGDILSSIALKQAISGNFSGAHWSLSFE